MVVQQKKSARTYRSIAGSAYRPYSSRSGTAAVVPSWFGYNER